MSETDFDVLRVETSLGATSVTDDKGTVYHRVSQDERRIVWEAHVPSAGVRTVTTTGTGVVEFVNVELADRGLGEKNP